MRRHPKLALLVFLLLGFALGAWGASRWLSRPEQVIRAYHLWFHQNGDHTYNQSRWLGTLVQKSPLDLFVFQEIIAETHPDVLVEAGTYKGGSARYFASLFDLLGRGRVISIDIEKHGEPPAHPRVEYLLGSSTAPEILAAVRSRIRPGERVMVVLDSDHHKDHVLKELELYHELVTPGCYLIVEDTHFNGNPILPKHGPGPGEAVQDFLRANADFRPDASREKYGMSFNRGGYLQRAEAR